MNADPFPHVVLDWWFDRGLLEAVATEFPDITTPGWKHYENGNEGKYEGGPAMWGLSTHDYFDELETRADQLGAMFDIDGLAMETVGGGYHLIPPGGHLQMHTDFNHSPRTGWCRRLNVLTFLNPHWMQDGGHLYLGADRDVDIAPEMGRTVAFATSITSWHGHPLPAPRWRKSVAAYFFTEHHAPDCDHSNRSTEWLHA